MNNFGHIKAMKVIFSSKCVKLDVVFKNGIEVGGNFDGFEHNW